MIFEHDNYLPWLKETIAVKAAEDPHFSCNAFSKQMGISQAYLSFILANKKPLTEKTARLLSKYLHMSNLEEQYLDILVKKNRTTDKHYRQYLDAEIATFRRVHKLGEKEMGNFKVIADWFYSALLEIVNLSGLEHDPKVFARRLGLTQKKVEEALKRLVDLDLLRLEKGKYIRNDPGFIEPPGEIVDFGLRKFHKQMMDKAKIAIDTQAVPDRHITGITLSINPDKLPLAKQRIEDFKRELSELLEVGERKMVFQFCGYLFRIDQD